MLLPDKESEVSKIKARPLDLWNCSQNVESKSTKNHRNDRNIQKITGKTENYRRKSQESTGTLHIHWCELQQRSYFHPELNFNLTGKPGRRRGTQQETQNFTGVILRQSNIVDLVFELANEHSKLNDDYGLLVSIELKQCKNMQ